VAKPIVAKGTETRVVFDGSTITLHPDVIARLRGKLRRGDGAKRLIPIDDIVAVELVGSTMLLNGYLRFHLAEDDEDDRPESRTGAAGVKVAARDPNAVTFSRYQAAAFRALHDAVAAAIAEPKTG
jgi:hypothetical protein